jgi:outer membrane receptor for ferrienterochelin and colicin
MKSTLKLRLKTVAVLMLGIFISAGNANGLQSEKNQNVPGSTFLTTLTGSALIGADGEEAGLLSGVETSAANPVQQEQGVVSGKVIDAMTGEPLIGANVVLMNTAIGAAANMDGEYTITRMPAGEQTLVIRYLGYVTATVQVTVIPGETVVLDISLQPDHVSGEEVVIYTQALGQANAIRQQLSSNTIVNVVSDTRLRELPDANAAESIGRLPGVAVLRDAGEGSRVAIRGMGPRYSSITIDGNRIPGTDGDRSVNLSMISPEMLAGIEVYKAIRPDMDADAIGGSVNFRMGGAPNETRYRVNLTGGYNNQLSEVSTYSVTASGSNRFLNNRLGVMASFTAEQVERSAHILGSSYAIQRDALPGEPHAPIEITSLNLTESRSIRERLGGGLSLDWRLDNGRIFFNNTFSSLDREDFRNDRNYNLSNSRQDWRPRRTERETSTLNSTLSGEHKFSGLQIDWRLNRSVYH